MMKKILFILLFSIALPAIAATNIDSVSRWAWNDVIGWMDFFTSNNVFVSSSAIQGYASSSVGWIAFNCANTPIGNVCNNPPGVGNWGVANDSLGNLSGYAWGDNIGWISFYCGNQNPSDCTSSNYRVTIDSNGDFNGYAWNDLVGWISFNCNNPGAGGCASSSYKVKTSGNATVGASLISSTYDAGSQGAFYTLMYEGNSPAGSGVKFQFASSKCPNAQTNYPTCTANPGSWVFRGPDGQPSSTYAPTGPDAPVIINTDFHNNDRYFRYRIILEASGFTPTTPRVDDVIITWSR